MQQQTARCKWLDVMKLLSVFLVYMSHHDVTRYGYTANTCVPVLFFCSGCIAYHSLQQPFGRYVQRLFSTLIWPYLTFSGIGLLVRMYFSEYALGNIIQWVKGVLYASRGTSPVVALWFFPALFFLRIYYYGLNRLLRGNRKALLVVCIQISVVIKVVHEDATLPWGMDQAGRYLIYFAMGDYLFQAYQQKPFAQRSLLHKLVAMGALFGGAFFYYLFFFYQSGYIASLFHRTMSIYEMYVEQFASVLGCTAALFLLSLLLQHIPLLCEMGQNSLTLCAGENIVKFLMPLVVGTIGLDMPFVTGPQGAMQCILFLFAAHYLVSVPVMRWMPFLVRLDLKQVREFALSAQE